MKLIITNPMYSLAFTKFSYSDPQLLMKKLKSTSINLSKWSRDRDYLKHLLTARYISIDPDIRAKMIRKYNALNEKIKTIKPIKSQCGRGELHQSTFLDTQRNFICPKIYTLDQWFDLDK